VATPGALERAASGIRDQREIAVDVEADSMFHFQEKVCLIQIATQRTVFIIDPLSCGDLSPLGPVFGDEEIRKIFHGSDFDVRSLYRDFGIDIRHLFDTELAARFLGIKESSLEALLASRFNVRLDKRFQRKDWSKRPLPEDMIAYAAGDVLHLIPLAHQLETELESRNRLKWVEEECHHLSRVRPLNNQEEPLFLSIKGAGRLPPPKLAVLEKLLRFRRKIAEEKDRPLFKVVSNRALLKVAADLPQTLEALQETNTISTSQIRMYGKSILEAVNAGLKIPKKDLPRYPRKSSPRLPAVVPRRVQALKAWRDRQADTLGMDPGLVINKTMIQAIAMENPCDVKALDRIPELRLWRKRAFGKAIVDTLKPVL
jgi:ribonuclease D